MFLAPSYYRAAPVASSQASEGLMRLVLNFFFVKRFLIRSPFSTRVSG